MKMNKPIIIVDHLGKKIPIKLIHNRRAKNFILKIDHMIDGGSVTIPRNTKKPEIYEFVEEKIDWLNKQLEALPPKRIFTDGLSFKLLGDEVTIRHTPELRGGVQLNGQEIFISGQHEHLNRRLQDWLKNYARSIIVPKANKMASEMNRKIRRISIRDTKSRWGSCSHKGNLSFCWRLIMAPEWVLNYVIAHEVTHLVHMDHSKEFWSKVKQYNVNVDEARKWLSKNGTSLYRIG